VYRNIDVEQKALRDEQISTLYVKFFDVDWHYSSKRALPLAQIQFADQPDHSLRLIPVVFITNRCLVEVDSLAIAPLAGNISLLLEKIAATNHLENLTEVQVDCDWTDKTRDKYFHLLRELRQRPFFAHKLLSATIRLFQAKYKQIAGVPPVDKGLLMAYNMGNLKNPAIANSILDPNEMNKYISDIDNYPLPLDLALPLFSWLVWFNSDNSYKGLVHDYDLPSLEGLPVEKKGDTRFLFTRDIDTLGFSFQKGDVLRKEESEANDVIKAGQLFARHFRGDSLVISCFHLDSVILRKYRTDVLEKIFSSVQR